MSENLAAVLLVWGVALVLEENATREGRLGGASLLGLATLARLQSGVVCVVVLGVLLARRSAGGTPVLEVFGTLVAWALVYGAWDAAAWHSLPSAKAGGFFHSAVVYYRFNIVENRGAGWGTAPWPYYFVSLFRTMPGVALALGISAVVAFRKGWPVLVTLAAFLALHLFVAHKELRFIVPVMPLACALPALALSLLPAKPARLGLVALAWWCWRSIGDHVKTLTMGEVGSYPERASSSAWDDFGRGQSPAAGGEQAARRVRAAHRRGAPRVDGRHHLPAPPGAALHAGLLAAVTATSTTSSPAPAAARRYIATEGPWELVKLGPTCVPDVNYSVAPAVTREEALAGRTTPRRHQARGGCDARVTDLVREDARHHRRWAGVARASHCEELTRLSAPTYGTIRGVTKLVGAGLDVALAQLQPLLEAPGAEQGAMLAVLNGVMGDYLALTNNPLAIHMELRSQGVALMRTAPSGNEAADAGARLLDG